jgi:hypothetical protein
LNLSGTRVTDAGLARLGTLPRLVRLNMSNTPEIVHGCEHIARWSELTELTVSDNAWLTDEQTALLKSNRRLAAVDFSNTRVTDETVTNLKGLPELKRWLLVGCRGITDRSLTDLRQQSLLQSINVDGTSITWKSWNLCRDERPDVFTQSDPLVFADFAELRAATDRSFWGSISLEGDVSPEALIQLSQLPGIRQLSVHSRQLTDDILIACLERSPELVLLDVEGAPITGRSLAVLSEKCPRVRFLQISHSGVVGRDVSTIAHLSELRSLGMKGLSLVGADLSALMPATHLEFLDLDGSTIGDAELASLNATNLAHLILRGTHVENDGLLTLAGHESLESLDLRDTAITHMGFAGIAAFPRLRSLSVGPGFDDNCTRALQGATLEHIGIVDPALSADGIAALELLPELTSLTLVGTVSSDVLLATAKLSRLRYLIVDRSEANEAIVPTLHSMRPDLQVAFPHQP